MASYWQLVLKQARELVKGFLIGATAATGLVLSLQSAGAHAQTGFELELNHLVGKTDRGTELVLTVDPSAALSIEVGLNRTHSTESAGDRTRALSLEAEWLPLEVGGDLRLGLAGGLGFAQQRFGDGSPTASGRAQQLLAMAEWTPTEQTALTFKAGAERARDEGRWQRVGVYELALEQALSETLGLELTLSDQEFASPSREIKVTVALHPQWALMVGAARAERENTWSVGLGHAW